MEMNDKNKLLQKRVDLQQRRADQLEAATKAYNNGDMTGYDAALEKVKGFNTELAKVSGLIAEHEKSFSTEDFRGQGIGEERVAKAGSALIQQIRGTEKYADAWMTAMRKAIAPSKGKDMAELTPLYEAEQVVKALSIGGGDPAGTDGGFLVPIDFDNRVIQQSKEYIDLSNLVTVENVSVNSGWRVIDSTGSRTKLPKLDEMGTINPGQQPKYNKINYNCAKYGDKLIISGELMADAPGLIRELADWWTPKYILTKNDLILQLLNGLEMKTIDSTESAAQIMALKTLLNTGLNTAHSKHATILTNCFGYDIMDNWQANDGRPMLVPDPKGGEFDRFKGRRVDYADADLIPDVTVGGKQYAPFYLGNLKAFCRLFLRQGTRIKSTDIGGAAWDTDSYEIRCTCRMDCQEVDGEAVKRAGILSAGGDA